MFVCHLYQKKLLQNSNFWVGVGVGAKNLYVITKTHNPFLKHTCEISTSLDTTTSSSKQQQHSFTVSYLIDSCGLSPEAAKSATKKVHFEMSERPDSVLNLFKNYSFTKAHISNLVRKRPLLLLAHPEKTLKPKLDFFSSLCISPSDLASLICCSPFVLECSLENRIIPAFELLKSILGTNKDVITAVKRSSWIFLRDQQQCMVPNIAILRNHGVPETWIAALVKNQTRSLTHKPDRFKATVNKVKKMGFDPLRYSFVAAVHVLLAMSKSTWKRKSEIYRKWGWSEDDIISAFRKDPIFMMTSEEKAEELMDFLVNKMGWESLDVARFPRILAHSFKRTTSRCLVIQLLLSKDLIKKNPSLSTMLISGEKNFLNNYVTKYCAEVPELLNFYQREMGCPALTIQSEGLDGTNNL